MDCTDCHNRPAHSFETPGKAINDSLVEGRIARSLPRIKQQGMQLIQASYEGPEQAGPEIAEALRAFYQSEYPNVAGARRADIDSAANELHAIYSRNIFPEYNVEWGTYPNQMGHEDYPGCYRCHDTEHVSQDARARPVGARCSSCHTMRVVDQPITSTSVTLLSESRGRAAIPEDIVYQTPTGAVAFDHGQHVSLAKGDCTACHNALFPMEKAPLNYGDNLHRTAEANKTSCAGCHVEGGEAFASANNCRTCHTNLSVPTRMVARIDTPPVPLPGAVTYQTSLGPASFDHGQHVDLANGNCAACHINLFPMEKAPLNYGDNLDKTAEANKTSCAGCHVGGGEAFASDNNCSKCHLDLGAPRITPTSGNSGIPAVISYATKLGAAPFDHAKHSGRENDDCKACHVELFGF
jgi:c(7)-type cytochrome triheme protein